MALTDAAWHAADRHSEARIGADRIRRVMADPTWADCDRWNGADDPAERERDGANRTRQWRIDDHNSLPISAAMRSRPWPILEAARAWERN